MPNTLLIVLVAVAAVVGFVAVKYLVLWRVDGPVRVVGATSNAELRTAVCPPG